MSSQRANRRMPEFAGRSRFSDGASQSPCLTKRISRENRHAYPTRFLACLAGSIGLILMIVNLPLGGEWRSVGWYVHDSSDRVHIDIIEVAQSGQGDHGSPITRIEANVEQPPPDEDRPHEGADDDPELLAANASMDRSIRRMHGRRVFDAAQQMPQIIGGLGSYYIHIEYPEEAMLAGIEGRLVLSFIVEPTGQTTSVEVVEALHPACDSAAVRALRRTRFVPGRQNGDVVPVRMRLPVRFKLVPPRGDELTDANETASS